MRYAVMLSAQVDAEYAIEAATPHEAVKLALERAQRERSEAVRLGLEDVPRLKPHAVVPEGEDGWELLGWCEGCERAILDTDVYGSDEEGCLSCTECMPAPGEAGGDEDDDGCTDPVEAGVGPEPTDYE